MSQSLVDAGLGRGVYGIADVAALTGIPRRRVRRWVRGYNFDSLEGKRHSAPIVVGLDYRRDDGVVQLSFRDVIEVRFVDAFLRHGVAWPELRRAAQRASQSLAVSHPFSTMGFRTDGHHIFAQSVDQDGDRLLWRIRDNQFVFERIIQPLLRDIEIRDSEIARWWPLGNRRRIVIDPQRNFGRPTAAVSGIPTFVLAAFAKRTSIREAAAWFEADAREVRDCLRFENRIAA